MDEIPPEHQKIVDDEENQYLYIFLDNQIITNDT